MWVHNKVIIVRVQSNNKWTWLWIWIKRWWWMYKKFKSASADFWTPWYERFDLWHELTQLYCRVDDFFIRLRTRMCFTLIFLFIASETCTRVSLITTSVLLLNSKYSAPGNRDSWLFVLRQHFRRDIVGLNTAGYPGGATLKLYDPILGTSQNDSLRPILIFSNRVYQVTES